MVVPSSHRYPPPHPPLKIFCQRLHSGHNKKWSRMSLKGYNVQNVAAPSYRTEAQEVSLQPPKYCRLNYPWGTVSSSTIHHSQGIQCPENSSQFWVCSLRTVREAELVSDSWAMLPPGGQQKTQLRGCQSFPPLLEELQGGLCKYPLSWIFNPVLPMSIAHCSVGSGASEAK